MDICTPEEDWGCVEEDELFFAAGPTPSLRTLVENFEKSRHTEEMLKHVATEFSQLDTGVDNSAIPINDEPEIIVKFEDNAATQITPIGILKKQPPNKDYTKKEHSLKRVSFEIERFVATNLGNQADRLDAEQQLLMKLGAKPARRKAVNYKQLKRERLEAIRKKEANESTRSLDKLLCGIQRGRKVMKFKARKRQNRSGILKKGTGGKWKQEQQEIRSKGKK